MKTPIDIERPRGRSRWPAILTVALALAVLAGVMVWAGFELRRLVRAQIVERDGETLDSLIVLQHGEDLTNGAALGSLSNPSEQVNLALEVSKLHNVAGFRLYSADGKFANASDVITDAPLPAGDLAELEKLHSVSRFEARARMEDQVMGGQFMGQSVAPLLFVEAPLRTEGEQPRLAGVIQFLMEGNEIAAQYARLDRNLMASFSIAFAVGAGILIIGLAYALDRERRAVEKLADRTRDLLQANRELALAARTSAVGAVASHLIHGLKNPLSGLRHFVRSRNAEGGGGSDTEWQEALGSTQRMEELINRVVRVLQEQQAGAEYEISISELAGMVAQRAGALAKTAGARFSSRVQAEAKLSNREADIIMLILENLAQNAIEATPSGAEVELSIAPGAGAMIFEVKDRGPGLAAGMTGRLFMPCVSSKKGGGGIGLAICRQLAQTLGAKLELASSGPSGCVFRLTVPQHSADAILQSDSETPPASRQRN